MNGHRTVKEEEVYRMIANSDPSKKESPDPVETPVSPEVKRRAMNPPLLGDISLPDGYAHVTGDCGDSMEVFLAIRDYLFRGNEPWKKLYRNR